MAKVQVARASDGKKVWVPEHWLDHPTLGKPFRAFNKTSPSRAGTGAKSTRTNESVAQADTDKKE